jgi:hypothetical protein
MTSGPNSNTSPGTQKHLAESSSGNPRPLILSGEPTSVVDAHVQRTGLSSHRQLGLDEAGSSYEQTARGKLRYILTESMVRLTPKAQQCCLLPELLRQQDVYNSAMVYTKIFNHLVVSRYDHQIHAAAQVAELRAIKDREPKQIQMTDYELDVLELALLFHDFGHVVGSHAMDQVFSAMSSRPAHVQQFYGSEFHEFHGAQEFGKGNASSRIRAILGSPLFDDVLAVLSFCDTRGVEEGDEQGRLQREQDYGSYSPTLSRDRLHMIHELCDRLDRSSYVFLDFCTAGYHDNSARHGMEASEAFVRTLSVTRDPLVVGNVLQPSCPATALILARLEHFSQVPAHPTNGLVGVFLQTKAWERFSSSNLEDADQLYEFVREAIFQDPREVLGEDAWAQLSQKELCITDSIAPVMTLDKSHFEVNGVTNQIDCLRPVKAGVGEVEEVPSGLVTSLCGAPLYEVSLFELRVRQALKRRGIDIPIYVLIAPVLDKSFKITRVVDGQGQTETRKPVDWAEKRGYVVVAAEALDRAGNSRDLSEVQEVVEAVINSSGWLKPRVSIREHYNPRVFVEPLAQSSFCDQVSENIEQLHPDWIKNGGSGLIRPSTPPLV